MMIGCNTVLFARLGLDDALQHIKWAGFEAAEIACISKARHVWPDFNDADIERTKMSFEKSGLKIVAMEAATDLLNDEKREWFYAALELAGKLGIPVVTTGSGGEATEEDLKRFESIAPELAEEAERCDVTVSVKAHVHAAVHNVASAIRAAKAANSEWVGINYDPTHLYREGEDILAAWDQLAPYVVHIHFRDLLGGENKEIGPPINQIPGRGVLDLQPLLERIVTSGYDRALDLEVIGAFDYTGGESLGIAAQSRGYFRRCMEQIESSNANRQ